MGRFQLVPIEHEEFRVDDLIAALGVVSATYGGDTVVFVVAEDGDRARIMALEYDDGELEGTKVISRQGLLIQHGSWEDG